MNGISAAAFYYSGIITSELVAASVLAIILLAMLTYREHRLSSRHLFFAIAAQLLFLLGDAASYYNLSVHTLPLWLTSVTYFVSYTFGFLVLIPFSLYSRAFIEERTPVRKWTYRVPVLMLLGSIVIAVAAILSGSVYGVVDGKMTELNGLPPIASLLQILVTLYLPAVAFTKRRQIGRRAVMLLGLFGILPILLYFVCYGLTGTGMALALIVVYVLIQCDTSTEREKQRKTLAELNSRLEEANEAKLAQIEEITALNAQLEEDQTRLEEAAEEQSAQLEEIRALNEQLQDNQGHLEESLSEQEAQLAEITTLNDQLQDNQSRLEEAYTDRESQLEEISALNAQIRENLSALTEQHRIVAAMSHDYHSAYLIDLASGRFSPIHRDGYSDYSEQLGNASAEQPYDASFAEYLDRHVAPEEAAELYSRLSLNGIRALLAERDYAEGIFHATEEGTPHTYEYRIIRPTTEEGAPDEAILGFKIIDELVAAEEKRSRELETAMEAARAANRSKSDFLSRMSHDIRTPMNIIVGMTEIAQRHFDDRDRVADCLAKINMESVQLQTLINDVLDISAIESGKLTIRCEEVRVKDIIENMNVSMTALVRTKSIDYVFEQGNLFFPYLNTDSLRISQVYLNLLSNAVKYTPAGGRVKLEIWQALSETFGQVELHARISDTGMGMSPEFMQSMYTEFSRAVDTRVNRIQGTGLGLAIVKQITDLMGGTIDVHSELNRGTTFHVILPVQIIEKTDARKALMADDFDYEELKGLRVLIAEDNDLNYEIAYELLSDHGMVISRAEDGAVALEAIASSEPGTYQLILMDMQMPVMDGLEATRRIRSLDREDAKQLPIIAMTANAFAEDALACTEAGMDAHVAKPIKVKLLLETILRLRKERG